MDFYTALMNNSVHESLSDEALAKAATSAGIDPMVLAKKIHDKKYQKELSDNVDLAHALGINGTPTFIINGHYLPGAMGYENIKDALANK